MKSSGLLGSLRSFDGPKREFEVTNTTTAPPKNNLDIPAFNKPKDPLVGTFSEKMNLDIPAFNKPKVDLPQAKPSTF